MMKALTKLRRRSNAPQTATTATGHRQNSAADFAEQHAARVAERTQQKLKRDAERNAERRKEERAALSVIAELSLPDKGFAIDGMVTDASKGGCTFRPAANYLEDRTGEHIQVIVEQLKRSGIIRSTRPDGYGIQLLEPMSEPDLRFLQQNSVPIIRADPITDDADE